VTRILKFGLGLVLLLAPACGEYTSEEARYSGDFSFWLHRSIGVSQEIDRARGFAEIQDLEAAFREQVRTMADRQLEYNGLFHSVIPPESLAGRHGRIRGVLQLYEEALQAFAGEPNANEPLLALVDRFDETQTRLLDAVITCYAESPAC
jgi:hypothetical protein